VLIDTVVQTLNPKPEERDPLAEAWEEVLSDGLSYLARKAAEVPAGASVDAYRERR
jgi:hypothetical protein